MNYEDTKDTKKTNADRGRLAGLDAYIENAMQAWGLPGLALAIVKDDEVVLARGYGVRESGAGDAVNEHTLFGIGSNTKAFTTTALAMLVHEGRLAWDDPAVTYLADFRFGDAYLTHAITVRDLVCHRSGLSTYQGDLLLYGGYSRNELIRRIRYLKPAYGFRSTYGYSNLMFLTAGAVIEAVTGASWDEFVKERIFKPLDMVPSTTGVGLLAGVDNVATAHTWIDGRIQALPTQNFDHAGPAGSINSSAWEMAQWLRFQLGEGVYAGTRLLDRETLLETRAPHTPVPLDATARRLFPSQHFAMYGLGWHLSDYHGRLLASHGGHVDGMFSRSAFLPEEQLGIVVLTNDERNDLKFAVLFRALDALLGLPALNWSASYMQVWKEAQAAQAERSRTFLAERAADMQLSLNLERYLGVYTHPVCGEAVFARVADKLRLQLTDHPALGGECGHWHYDTFVCRWDKPAFRSSLLPFTLDGEGNVMGFRLKIREEWIDSQDYAFSRSP